MTSDSIWSLLTAVMLPLSGGAFMLLWSRLERYQRTHEDTINNLWSAINHQREEVKNHRVDCERRFVKIEDHRLWEDRLDLRLGRIEDKLDGLRACEM